MEITTKNFSGNYEIIAYDKLFQHSKNDQLITKCFFKTNTGDFEFTLEFNLNEEKGKERELSHRVDSEKKTIKFYLLNFDEGFGAGNTNPINIATIEGKKVFIRLWAKKISDSFGYSLEYYLYWEK